MIGFDDIEMTVSISRANQIILLVSRDMCRGVIKLSNVMIAPEEEKIFIDLKYKKV